MTTLFRSALRLLLGASASALLLSACVSFKGIETSNTMRAPSDYALADAAADQGGNWPDRAWAEAIGGAPLQALIDQALRDNPGLQVATARVAAAQAMVAAARAAGGPMVGGALNSTYQRYSEHYIFPPPLAGTFETDNQAAVNFSYDLDFWGKHSAELRAALSEGKAAQAERHAAQLLVATAVAHAWVQLARQHAQLELTEQQLAVAEKFDRLTQLRIKAGLDTQSDAELTRRQSAALRAEQAQWQEAIALTRNQLAALAGMRKGQGFQVDRPVLPAAAGGMLPDRLPLSLLGRRPDIVAARWRVEAAQGQIDSAKAQFYPNVNLIAFAGLTSLGLSNLVQTGSRSVGIGPAVRLPIFEGGALRAQLRGKAAAYDAAVASYNQTLSDALREVADQVQSLRAADAQDAHLAAAAHAAENTFKLARERERAGTSNMLPVLSSEAAWLVQRKLELDSRIRRADLRIGLVKALGGGFEAAALSLEVQ